MQNTKALIWRVVLWILGLLFGGTALTIIILLCISFLIGPKPKPDEKWQVYLVLAIEFVLIYLSILIFRKLFKKDAEERPTVLSARHPKSKVNTSKKGRFDERNPRFTAFFERVHVLKLGIDYLTFADQQKDGTVYASRWFVFGFLPLIPLSYDRVRKGEKQHKTHIPLLASSSRFSYERIETHPMPKRLRRATWLHVYAFLLPTLLLLTALLIVHLVHPEIGYRQTPAWVYFVTFGGYILMVGYNEYWHTRRFLQRSAPFESR